MDWWLILRLAGAAHVYHLGALSDVQRAVVVERAMVKHTIPLSWIDEPGWDVQLSPGDPHPSLLAAATLHDLAELGGVTDQQLIDHRRAVAAATRAERLDAAARLVNGLAADEQDEFLDRYRPNIGGVTRGGTT